jgi:hypothetical protein
MEGRRYGPAQGIAHQDLESGSRDPFFRSATFPGQLHCKAKFPLDLDVTSTRSLHQKREVQEVSP